MNMEKYTERTRGFVQSAQSLAIREGHQQFTPEHVLKVLLDDEEGLSAGLIDKAGGARATRSATRNSCLPNCRRCKVLPLGNCISPRRRRAFSTMPRRSRKRRATPMSRSSGCCSRLPWRKARTPARFSIGRASRRKLSTRRSRISARAAPPTIRPPKTPTMP